jgi:hypothetical protein
MLPQAKMIQDFDPNAQHKPFATYLPARSPAFKVHSRRQDALGALAGYWYGVLYKFGDVGWEEITRKVWDEKIGKCDNCGCSTLNNSVTQWDGVALWFSTGSDSRGRLVPNTDPSQYDHGTFLLRRFKGRITEPPEYLFVCPDCVPLFSR